MKKFGVCGVGLCVRVAMIAAAIGISGCSVAPVESSQAPVELVGRLAEARWKLLLDGKLDDAYDMYVSPAAKQLLSRDAYRGGIKLGIWTAATVEGVVCDDALQICKASVKVSYVYKGRVGGALANNRVLEEAWRRVDGRWWFVPNP